MGIKVRRQPRRRSRKRLPEIRENSETGLKGLVAGAWTGINTCKAPFLLQPSELAEACDVDIGPDGSVCRRNAVRPFAINGPFDSAPCSITHYEDRDCNVTVIIGFEDGSVREIAGGVPGPAIQQGTPPPNQTDCCWTFTQLGFGMIMSDGENSWFWIPGTGNYAQATPGASGEAGEIRPGLKYKCYDGRLWVIDKDQCLARYSNPLQPTLNGGLSPQAPIEFDDLDFIQSGFGKDAQCILGIECCGTQAFTLEQSRVSIIGPAQQGVNELVYDPATLTTSSGPVGPKAYACCNNRLYYWDGQFGLQCVGPNEFGDLTVSNVSEPICDILTNMELTDDQSNVAVGCCNGRIYVSVPTVDPTCNDTTYIFDPGIGEAGAWTKHSYGIECFYEMVPTKGKPYCLGLTKNGVVMLDQMGFDSDNFGEGEERIEGSFCTSYYDNEENQRTKLWCGIDLVVDPSPGLSIEITGLGDYSDCQVQGRTNYEAGPQKIQDPFILKPAESPTTLTAVRMEVCAPGEEPQPIGCSTTEPCTGVLKPIPDAPITIRPKVNLGQSRSLAICIRNITSADFCVHQMTLYYRDQPLKC